MASYPPLGRRILAAVTALWVAVAMSLGCTDEVATPEEVAASFLSDLRQGERQEAMDAIWPETRDELESAHAELEAYFEGDSPVVRSRILSITRLESPLLIARIRAEEAVPDQPTDGQLLTVKIEFRDERTADIPMRWSDEEGRWFVDLPIESRRSLEVLPNPPKEMDEAKRGVSAEDQKVPQKQRAVEENGSDD